MYKKESFAVRPFSRRRSQFQSTSLTWLTAGERMMAAVTDIQFAATPATFFQKRPGGMAEPLDCSTPALDLCVRKRPARSPTPEGAYHHQPETPSSTILLSPSSEASSDTSLTSDASMPTSYLKIKATRPFKAYPKDPLSLAAETILGRDSAEAYAEFRKRMLSTAQQNYSATNKNMRRTVATATSAQNADPSYWEKRRKNNEAAKRSRDARRAKEDEIAIRCAFLEQENIKLRYEVAALRDEAERYRAMMYK